MRVLISFLIGIGIIVGGLGVLFVGITASIVLVEVIHGNFDLPIWSYLLAIPIFIAVPIVLGSIVKVVSHDKKPKM